MNPPNPKQQTTTSTSNPNSNTLETNGQDVIIMNLWWWSPSEDVDEEVEGRRGSPWQYTT